MGEDEKEDLSEGSFNSKSPWRRISVIAAGPVFNFILAFVFGSAHCYAGGLCPAEVTQVESGSMWLKLVFRKGILSKNIRVSY